MRYPALLLPLLLTACATTGSGDGTIAVAARAGGKEISGANCLVSTGAGSWNVVTPATVTVGSASGDLRVVCNKAGYRTSEVIYRPTSGSGSSVGLGVGGGGGNVGVGVGLNFPIRLGGGSYPSHVTVEMNPQ